MALISNVFIAIINITISSILEATINNTTTDKRVDEKIAKLLSDQTLSSIKKNKTYISE